MPDSKNLHSVSDLAKLQMSINPPHQQSEAFTDYSGGLFDSLVGAACGNFEIEPVKLLACKTKPTILKEVATDGIPD